MKLAGVILSFSVFANAHSIEDWKREQSASQQPLEKALLVTAESLAEAWLPFVEWKRERGIEVEVATVQMIDEKLEGPDVQEKIRLFVQKEISENQIRWLILGGDSLPDGGGLVPDRDTLHETMWGRNIDIPTDIYYLSPTNWDADGDGVYGEFEEDQEAISYPDGSVGLGRIPVRTVEDVQAYTDKVIFCETNTPEQSFRNSFLYTCTVSEAYAKLRRSWDDSISEVLEEGEVTRYFADETPWDSEKPGDYQLNHLNLTKLFNEGRFGKMHLHGHGAIEGWIMEGGQSLFGYWCVNNLKNEGHYPMITTVSCFTGQYDASKDPSIAEAMLRKSKAGAIAIVAPCREGKPHFVNPEDSFPLMMSEGKLDGTTKTMTRFWAKGLAENLSAGESLMATKAELIEKAKESANLHMCLCELNLLGDPTLAVSQSNDEIEQ